MFFLCVFYMSLSCNSWQGKTSKERKDCFTDTAGMAKIWVEGLIYIDDYDSTLVQSTVRVQWVSLGLCYQCYYNF